MNPHAKPARGRGPLGGIPPLGAAMSGPPPGVEMPQINPNACAVNLNVAVHFPDGEAMQFAPPAVGTETGDVEEVLTRFQRSVDRVKAMIRLKFEQRTSADTGNGL